MRCAAFDVVAPVPPAPDMVQLSYLYEHLRAYTIGRDPTLPVLRVFVPEPWSFRRRDLMVPEGAAVTFENRHGIRPHRVRFLPVEPTYEVQARVRCIHCGAEGRYFGELDERFGRFGPDGVRLREAQLDMSREWDAAAEILWDTAPVEVRR